ncbi:hypothetical protein [Glycomyces tritici]|uniref:DUF4352 domain-containing protein n=1 Tax=Glycomyces tritici TaxID=2665176 RepID=A0ABT7YJJ9_9ACTN|nr:hypothetical protein [Glycomyces tritici]MDN3238786.1 hypothetical protein [Glycomyces tritici]
MSQPPASPPPEQYPPNEPPPASGYERPTGPAYEPPRGPQPYEPPPGPPPFYPPPPGPPADGTAGEPSKTIAILALVFGGAALLFGLIPVAGIFLGGAFALAGIVLGVVGIFKSHRLMSIIGIGLAVLGLIVTVIVTVAVGKAAEDIIEDWPTDYGTEGESGSESESDDGTGHGDLPKDQVVDGTDPNAPLPAGSEIATGNWTVVISEVVPDATEEVMAENEFNTPPPEGSQFFMFRVEATYQGEASSFAWSDLLFGVFIEDSVHSGACGVIPDDLFNAPEVFAGGTATGNFCVIVPSAGVESAAIGVEDFWASGQRYFVAAS